MSIIRDVQQLRVGDFVTIYDRVRPWPREINISDNTEGLFDWNSVRGIPVQVRAISPPFIMCELRLPNFPHPYPFPIELDRFQIYRVSRAYMESFSEPN